MPQPEDIFNSHFGETKQRLGINNVVGCACTCDIIYVFLKVKLKSVKDDSFWILQFIDLCLFM